MVYRLLSSQANSACLLTKSFFLLNFYNLKYQSDKFQSRSPEICKFHNNLKICFQVTFSKDPSPCSELVRRSSAISRQSSQQPHENELFLASSLVNFSDVSSTICLLVHICIKDSKQKSPCQSLLTLLVMIIKCCLSRTDLV